MSELRRALVQARGETESTGEAGFDDLEVAKSTMLAIAAAEPERTWRPFDHRKAAYEIDLGRQLSGELRQRSDSSLAIDHGAYGIGQDELLKEGKLVQLPDQMIQFNNHQA